MPLPAALLDEDTSRAIDQELRRRGYDVLSVHQVGPRNVPDAQVLERATALGRVIVTHNTDDYKALQIRYERAGRTHAGIICIPQVGPVARRALR